MNIIDLLRKHNVIIENDHFVYTSGKHGSIYIFKDALYPHTQESSKVGEMFAERHKDLDIDVVVSPAVGGIILSQWTAYHLSQFQKKEILGLFTEKTPENNQVFKRGYDKLVKGKKVLVIEDTTNTGGSVVRLINSVKKAGGIIVAVSVMINRDPIHVNSELFGAPFSALGEFPAEAFLEDECPLCKKGIPINTEIGHGKQFVEKQSKH